MKSFNLLKRKKNTILIYNLINAILNTNQETNYITHFVQPTFVTSNK